jgi:hypothetical protein
MIPRTHYKKGETGFTLLDLLAVISGVAPGIWLSSYFHGTWRTVMGPVLSLVFGISLWCFLFLWLAPLIERHRKALPGPDDDNNPNE